MNHQMNIDEAIAIAKEYHLEIELTILSRFDYLYSN